jgi:hypothetical protein
LAGLSACGSASASAGCGDIWTPPSFDPAQFQAPAVRPPVSNFDRKYAAWLRSPAVRDVDLTQIAHHETNGDGAGGWPTFECAVDRADLVVTGTVQHLDFLPEATLTNFKVDWTAKGSATGVIHIVQSSHLFPEKGEFPSGPFGAATISDEPGSPLLLPGQRALLFLVRTGLSPMSTRVVPDADPNQVRYGIWDQSGGYVVADGRVKALPTNPITDVDGHTEKELMDRAASRAASAPA